MNDELISWLKEASSKLKIVKGNPRDIFVGRNMIMSCKYCEQQFNISRENIEKIYRISDKVCVRHLPYYVANYWKVVKTPQQIIESVKKSVIEHIQRFNETNGKDEARDLARPENKEILDWFKNPTQIQ